MKDGRVSKKIINKGATFHYDISDKLEAGIVLHGYEVKGIRERRANLVEGFVRIEKGEAWLYGVNIGLPENARIPGYEPSTRRKLLLKKKEIDHLEGLSSAKGLVIVPLELKWVRNRVKVLLGLGKGVKKHDKRRKIAEREQRREIAEFAKAH